MKVVCISVEGFENYDKCPEKGKTYTVTGTRQIPPDTYQCGYLILRKNFENPMLTVSTVNTESDPNWKVLINTFGAKAIKKWDGDILNRYAAIEIEKKYPI